MLQRRVSRQSAAIAVGYWDIHLGVLPASRVTRELITIVPLRPAVGQGGSGTGSDLNAPADPVHLGHGWSSHRVSHEITRNVA